MCKYVVYLLRSEKDGRYYIGHTTNLQRRLEMHNNGQVKSTKSRRPLKLQGCRVFKDLNDARYFEYQVKHHSDKKRKFVGDILQLSEPEARTP